MFRLFSACAVLTLLAASSAAQSPAIPGSRADDPMGVAIAHLDRSEYAEALSAFDKALDSYAAANRLDDVRHAYIRMFVGNRNHANVLMKAMTSWVGKHRASSGESLPSHLAEFDVWVHERAALAAATVNLAHNSPDWK